MKVFCSHEMPFVGGTSGSIFGKLNNVGNMYLGSSKLSNLGKKLDLHRVHFEIHIVSRARCILCPTGDPHRAMSNSNFCQG